MQLSKAGAGFIAGNEAIYCEAYPDAGYGWKVPSIGLGHTSAAGPPIVNKGDIWPLAKVFQVFANDVTKIESAVNRLIKVQLSQPAFDALCDFQHNTGAINSPNVAGRFNRGDTEGALRTMGLYVNSNGKRFEALVTRRKENIAMFRTGAYPRRPIMVRDRLKSSPRYINSNSIPWRDDVPAAPPLAIDLPLAPVEFQPPVPNLPAVVPQPKPMGFFQWLWATLRNSL